MRVHQRNYIYRDQGERLERVFAVWHILKAMYVCVTISVEDMKWNFLRWFGEASDVDSSGNKTGKKCGKKSRTHVLIECITVSVSSFRYIFLDHDVHEYWILYVCFDPAMSSPPVI